MQMGVNSVKLLKTLLIFVCTFVFFIESAEAFQFTSHGYYRNRVNFTYNLDTQKPRNTTVNYNRFGVISYNQMRLRIEPTLKLNDFLSVHSQLDLLDNLIYGTSDTQQIQVLSPVVGTITLPAGAGSISMVGGAAGENGSINVRRAWAEILTPVGKLKFGRQPSNWGLGIFQNDGNGWDSDFGDTADRILFITQKQFEDGSSISIGALWDIAFEAQVDPRTQGLGGVIRDNGQDTNQWAGVLLYERPEATFGIFGGIRKRDGGNGTTTTALGFNNNTGVMNTAGLVAANNIDTSAGIDGNTLIYFVDAYGRYSWNEYNFEFEAVYLGGKISTGVALDAIPLVNPMPAVPRATNAGVMQMPANQPMGVLMAAFEADARYSWGGEWNFKAGFAQGDKDPLSNKVTQYGFRPDYQIGLIMFHMPLGTSAAIVPSGGAYPGQAVGGQLPITGNFINNAIYFAGTYMHHFDFGAACPQCNDFSAGLRVLSAFAQEPPTMLNFAQLLNTATYPTIRSNGKWYGVEIDVMVEGRFFDYLKAVFEGGVLIPGSAYDVNVNLLNNTMISAIPTVRAVPAYAGRVTLMLDF